MEKTTWPNFQRSLVAILRGIKPDETPDIVQALYDAGFRAIEIPLNSPDAFVSIKRAVDVLPDDCLIGAGTVLTIDHVNTLADVGGQLMISPNVVPKVIKRASSFGMVTMPGVFTATEAFRALDAGASGLKFFPAFVLGPSGISALQAVLPKDIEIGAVGGVSDESFAVYAKFGVRTFGLGSCLYRPGDSALEVVSKAENSVRAYDAVFAPN